ncbi:hypothetical protein [Snodgrassella alvi]|uniref:Uncharacterized protein n=1 Tax=Snodgrassella alvi TaxID=1196083 RepID=A0A2N9WU68_9NEIS|nr:hypothetical protein [Snodgrassella alvi]PIT15018.1 hypothetical protein BGI33_06630 [Snodgrassella alvi]PIT15581.1 hypothetical protein BGI32_05280 [Snodgrassella alvi]PIT16287.1 hypothetical protein BGI34_09585 [Snodgrassella alvi]
MPDTSRASQRDKNQNDLGKLTGSMNNLIIETALNVEIAENLGYEKTRRNKGEINKNFQIDVLCRHISYTDIKSNRFSQKASD